MGALLLFVGLSILGYAAWQFYGTNIASRQAASQEAKDLRARWTAPAAKQSGKASATPVPGDAMALMRIPDLGADWEYPVLAGTDPDTLSRGVGWYTHGAQPGQVGNFAVAAHRVTHGEPFRHLLQLRKGSQVVVETRDATYTYELDDSPGQLTVTDAEGWVLDPVPGHPDQQATKPIITLTTCSDLFHSPRRSVAFGHLVSTVKK